MKLVIFGLTVSSSWGNGHATLWRGLCRALVERRHEIVFVEKDVPYYAEHRDLHELPGGELVLYKDWDQERNLLQRHVSECDVAMVTSYCPDALAATELVLSTNAGLRVFYDLDTPVTLHALQSGQEVAYIGPNGLSGFDLVLSYTGGQALEQLKTRLGATRVAPLFGSVDPAVHHPAPAAEHYRADLSYLGTYAEDRQAMLERLFIAPARQLPDLRFLIGGAMYPGEFPWGSNIYFRRHVAPPEHPSFYCSSRLTLNVTRAAMATMGYCPSGRLFEAAACGVPILSDWWEGLDQFFTPGQEILVATTTSEAVEALKLPLGELAVVARNARNRALEEHTASHRAIEFERQLEDAFAQRCFPSCRLTASQNNLAPQQTI